jgi:PAS domain-containing protein
MEKIVQIFAVRAAAELERKQAEEALRQAEERYRSIFENTRPLAKVVAGVLWGLDKSDR